MIFIPYYEVVVLKGIKRVPYGGAIFKTIEEATEVFDELTDRGILARIVESDIDGKLLTV